MNERIEKLAREAGYEIDVFGIIGHWDMPELRKFAELIVRECIEQVNKDREEYVIDEYNDDWNSALDNAADNIKKHFGVE